MDLKVNDIFHSIEGESTRAGFPCVLIRLTGCNLNCEYCDTLDAKTRGEFMSDNSIIEKIENYKTVDHITITGGEPLLQKNTTALADRLIKMNLHVQIETNGSISISGIPKNARKIVDIKTPSSGESQSFLMENIELLTLNDELKFVIRNKEDYSFSKNFITKHLYNCNAVINFSPVHNEISPMELAELILADNLAVRLNLQIHKIIGLK
ncbi:radical SAM protein [Spirochaetota bacterium]